MSLVRLFRELVYEFLIPKKTVTDIEFGELTLERTPSLFSDVDVKEWTGTARFAPLDVCTKIAFLEASPTGVSDWQRSVARKLEARWPSLKVELGKRMATIIEDGPLTHLRGTELEPNGFFSHCVVLNEILINDSEASPVHAVLIFRVSSDRKDSTVQPGERLLIVTIKHGHLIYVGWQSV